MDNLPVPKNTEVIVPEKQMPLHVAGARTGETRPTRLSDIPEVYEHACALKACFVPDRDIAVDLQRKFGLSISVKTIESMARLKTYGPIIDKYRKKFAHGKIRGIPYAYRFKRLEKLSKMMEACEDPKEAALLDESIRREMDKCEDVLFENTADEELTPEAKKLLLVQTTMKLLSDPTMKLEGLEADILKAADKIQRMRRLAVKSRGGAIENAKTTEEAK